MALGRDVAIKELAESGRKDTRRLKQFVKEASFLAQFEHENILRIHSVDQERGWIVMELMKGTLASQVADEPMPADTVRSVMRQILGALDFLHQKNKVHGAVRASNILINDVGTVKLSDFEAADMAGELRAPTGSKKHLAPELIRTEFGTFGPTTDLYCLGFTALELLAGPNFASFFPGTGEGAIDEDVAWLRWHSSDEALPPVKQLCPNTPDDLAEVIDQLLSKNVADRPQSVAAVLEQLSEQAFIPVIVKDAVPSISPTPVAPPPPASREMAAGVSTSHGSTATRGRQTKSKTAAAAATVKPSKGKLNDFLEKPYVLWPLCASILIGALFVGLKLQGDSKETAALAKVRILAKPDGADITLGDTEYTPDEKGLFAIEPGPYELSVKKAGFQTHTELLELNAGLNEFPISLSPIESPPPSLAKVRIRVMPEPDGANILVNSNQLETDSDGKVELAPGDYDLRVTKDGYEAYQQTFNVTADTDELLVSLIAIEKPTAIGSKPELAKIRLKIRPDGNNARITFDGIRHSPNANGIIELEPKLYQLVIEKDGFNKYADTLVASSGPNEVAILLEKNEIQTVTKLNRLENQLRAAYDKKTNRPEYISWKNKFKIPTKPEPFPEEATVKQIRSAMTALVEAPPSIQPIEIPTKRGRKPIIDGKLEHTEAWNSCRILKLTNSTVEDHDPSIDPTEVHIVASDSKLYMGVIATHDTTEKGLDTVGFYFHFGVTKLIVAENIIIRPSNSGHGLGFRQTKIPFRGQEDKTQQWMKYPISEWRIYEKARINSSMVSGYKKRKPHRHYELELDLVESGIHPGIPFQAYIEVETDPLLTNKGQFAGRQYLGKVGSEKEPSWFVINP